MFAGHYSVSYAMKKREPKIPLYHLFFAAQFMDVFWSIFVMLGIEKADVNTVLPGSHIHLTYMPYTHSLIGSLGLSALMYFMYRWLRPGSKQQKHRQALLMGITVFSHWVLDLIMHDGDLPLLGNKFKVGFGLYHSAPLSFLLEAVFLAVGLWMYLRSTTATTWMGKYGMTLFFGFLMIMNAMTMWGPIAPTAKVAAAFNLISYLLFTFIAARLEKKRNPIESQWRDSHESSFIQKS